MKAWYRCVDLERKVILLRPPQVQKDECTMTAQGGEIMVDHEAVEHIGQEDFTTFMKQLREEERRDHETAYARAWEAWESEGDFNQSYRTFVQNDYLIIVRMFYDEDEVLGFLLQVYPTADCSPAQQALSPERVYFYPGRASEEMFEEAYLAIDGLVDGTLVEEALESLIGEASRARLASLS